MKHYALPKDGLLAAALLLVSLVSFAQKRKPAPVWQTKQKFTIDGDASDWKIPAAIFLKSQDGKAQMRLAATFKAFYAFVEVEDKSPLKNGADRPEEMFKGGDTVAFYFQIEKGKPQRVAACHRAGKNEVYVYREKSNKKKPYVFSSPVGTAKFDYVAPANGAKVAFKKRPGKGYTMEIELPWRQALDNWQHQPKTFRFDAQVVFSDPGGTQNAGAAWLFAKEGPGLTIEDLPTEAKLYPDTWGETRYVNDIKVQADKPVLAISKPVGGAEIQVQLPRDGRLTLNITDQKGWILRELVMARKYSAGTHRIHWDGRDRYGEVLPPGTYKWKALLFDGMRTHFMGSVGNSGRPPYRTPDGLGSMGGQHGYTKSVAQDRGGVYMSNASQEGPPVMRKIDPVTGKALWMRSAGSGKGVAGIAAGEGMACFINDLRKRGDFARDLVRMGPKTGYDLKMSSGTARVRLDELKGKDRTAGIAIVDGKAWISISKQNQILSVDLKTGKKGKPLNVKAPQGLARQGAGRLLVCSQSQLLSVNVRSGAQTVIIKGLEAPRDVCVDTRGNIYVAELGNSQRVKKFSRDGKRLLAAWGLKGGKRNHQIPYNPMAFRNVTNLAVGPKGNVWLAESDPLVRRFVKLNADGKWLEDFYGPVAYNTFGPNLDDFSTVYYTISGGSFIETKIDYAQYRKNPMAPSKAWRIVAIHDMGLGTDGKSRNETMAKLAGFGYGHVIAFRGKNGKRYFFRFSKLNRATAPIGAGIWIERNGRWVPCAFVARDTKKYKSWADQNGDGLIQANEQYEGLPLTRAAWIDRDLTLHGFGGKLAPASVSEAGIPNYAGGVYRPYLNEGEKSHLGDQWTFVSRATDDSVYYISNHGPHLHLSFWDRATENRLIKVKNGKVEWVLGKHDPRPRFVELSTNSGVAGVQDGVILVQNIEPCNYVAFTEDGFVLGDIMVDDQGNHPKVGPFVINIESFTGLYLKDPKTGKNVLFTVSSGDDRILEVTGPGKTDRMQGTVVLREATPRKPANLEIPYSSWYGNTPRNLGVDGEDTEWRPEVLARSIMAGKQVVGDIKFRRDAGNLYLHATVLDGHVAAGDGLELVIANAAANGERYKLSLALERVTRKVRKKEVTAWEATPTLTHNGTVVKAAEIKTAVRFRWMGYGYRVEAEIPLSLLTPLTRQHKVSYRRKVKGKRGIGTIREVKPDLKGPVFVDVRLMGTAQPASLSAGGRLLPVVVE